jgi:hypothetical protein
MKHLLIMRICKVTVLTMMNMKNMTNSSPQYIPHHQFISRQFNSWSSHHIPPSTPRLPPPPINFTLEHDQNTLCGSAKIKLSRDCVIVTNDDDSFVVFSFWIQSGDFIDICTKDTDIITIVNLNNLSYDKGYKKATCKFTFIPYTATST